MTFIIWLVSNLQLLSDQIMNRKEIKKIASFLTYRVFFLLFRPKKCQTHWKI